MKKLICCLVLVFSVSVLFSQRVYFIYLQSEADPFFVKMNEQVYSSGNTGYVILSKLRDSSYAFAVGFPQNKWPEQQFKVDVKGRDHGFLLKNFGEKGWGLYDLQTLSVQMAAPQPAKATSMEATEVSAFTDILAKAANDPSLRDRPVPVKQQEQPQPVAVKKEETKEKETAPVQAVVKTEVPVKKEELPVVKEKDPPVVKGQIEAVTKPKKEEALAVTKEKEKPPVDPTVKKEEALVVNKEKEKPPVETVTKTDLPVKKEEPPVVIKAAEKAPPVETIAKADIKKEELPLTVADNVPVKKEEVKPVATEEYKPSVVRRRSESSTTEGFGLTFVDDYGDGKKDTIRIIIPPVRYMNVVAKETPKEEKKFLDISTDAKETVSKPAENNTRKNCPAVAAESDFLKLRKKMSSENKDDGMVSEAAKSFKTKCFTVAQLKNLSALFLNDAGKYKFFDVAYTHVSDADNFTSLQAELKDEYYINRFKAMLR